MAKKLVQNITAREEDFAQWYTDVVREAKLCDYSGVKGCMNYLPNGYASVGEYSEGTWMHVSKRQE